MKAIVLTFTRQARRLGAFQVTYQDKKKLGTISIAGDCGLSATAEDTAMTCSLTGLDTGYAGRQGHFLRFVPIAFFAVACPCLWHSRFQVHAAESEASLA